MFDVLAHLDLVCMLPPANEPPRSAIQDALDAIAEAGVAVEINGSGMRRDGRPYPDAPLLAGLRVMRVAVFRSRGLGWREG